MLTLDENSLHIASIAYDWGCCRTRGDYLRQFKCYPDERQVYIAIDENLIQLINWREVTPVSRLSLHFCVVLAPWRHSLGRLA